nr:hypothetical protein [Microbispora triticiradicis]
MNLFVLGHGQVSDLGVVEKPEQVHVRVQASERLADDLVLRAQGDEIVKSGVAQPEGAIGHEPVATPLQLRHLLQHSSQAGHLLGGCALGGSARRRRLEEKADLKHVLESLTGDLGGNAIAGVGHTHDQALGLHAVQSVSDRRLRDPQLSRQDVDRDAGARLDP